MLPSAPHKLTKLYLLFRAEIGQFHPEPEPFGWRIYNGPDRDPVSRSVSGFAVECAPTPAVGVGEFIDLPASYHNGACGISFADGHAEVHKWLGGAVK